MDNSNFFCLESVEEIKHIINNLIVELNDEPRNHCSTKDWSDDRKLYWNLLAVRRALSSYQSLSIDRNPNDNALILSTVDPCSAFHYNTNHHERNFLGDNQNELPIQTDDHQEISSPSNDYMISKLDITGFIHISQALTYIYPLDDMFLSIAGNSNTKEWFSSRYTCTNPSFSYRNTPLFNWRKDVNVRMTGKSMGTLEVTYAPPEGNRRLRSKIEVQNYFQKHQIHEYFSQKFEFKAIYCICHNRMDNQGMGKQSYIECSYGKAGCGGWVHPECVGLGSLNTSQLMQLNNIICPYCFLYLTGTNQVHLLVGKMILKRVTFESDKSNRKYNRCLEIEKVSPFAYWGIEGTSIVYKNHSIVHEDAFEKNGYPTTEQPHWNEMSDIHKLTYESPNSLEAVNRTRNNKRKNEISSPLDSNRLGIFQHRLFAGLDMNCNQNTIETSSTSANSLKSDHVIFNEEQSVEKFGNISETINQQDDEHLLSHQRVKYAQYEDGTKVKVRVTGGWIKRQDSGQIQKNAKQDESNGQNDNGYYDYAKEIIEKSKLHRDGSYRHLHDKYDEILIDNAISKALSVPQQQKYNVINPYKQIKDSTNRKKDHDVIEKRTKSGNTKIKSVRDIESLTLLIDPPICTYMPAVDGGLRYVCLTSSNLPRSMHIFCSLGLVCGYCLLPFNPGKTAQNKSNDVNVEPNKAVKAVTTHSMNSDENVKTKKKRLKSKKKKKKNEDLISWKEKVVSVSVGAVDFYLHQACAYMAEEGSQLLQLANRNSLMTDLSKCPQVSDKTEVETKATFSISKSDETKNNEIIQVNHVYAYDEPDDCICDLCGRQGGILQFFSLDKRCSRLPEPSEDGWVAHVSCIYWLIRSNILAVNPHRNCSTSSDEKNRGKRDASERNDYNELIKSDCEEFKLEVDDVSNHGNDGITIICDSSHETAPIYPVTSESSPSPRKGYVHTEEQLNENGNTVMIDDKEMVSNLIENVHSVERITTLDVTEDFQRKKVIQSLSEFDHLYMQYRCCLCGLQAGVCLRCSALFCTLRAHPLCIMQANHPWKIGLLSEEIVENADGEPPISSPILSFLCAEHSPVDS